MEDLNLESEKLARSWMRHERDLLARYLVSGVEDPRINVQSILSRHFLTRAVAPGRFEALMHEEYRFAAVMNWLLRRADELSDPDAATALLHALRLGADNSEGEPIPYFLTGAFQALPASADAHTVPNYLSEWLSAPGGPFAGSPVLATFQKLWRNALAEAGRGGIPASALEPACGSANDFRFVAAYGLGRWVQYLGLDICEKNVENARALFPAARFETANVFSLPGSERSFDLCFIHDLFEHLSPAGFEQAVAEVCRVTREGMCIGFFNMDEAATEHHVLPYEEYHWNTLSLERTCRSFEQHDFAVSQIIHIGTFLREAVGCDETHNPNAYTLILRRAR